MGQTEERRKWPRLDVSLKIRLRPVAAAGVGTEEKIFYTKNISTGGLLFESEQEVLSHGGVFDVEISMPLAKYGFTSSRRLEARGKVCRVEKSLQERSAVALEFMAPPRFVTP